MKLSTRQYRLLINAANIQSGLLDQNFITSEIDLIKFSDISLGIPILIEADKDIFDFDLKDVFNIKQKNILKIIYGIDDLSYIGFKHSFNDFEFLSKFSIKSSYSKIFNKFVDQNKEVFRVIKMRKDKFENVSAFQTRNIPHFGHEKIIQRMLDMSDHLIINPVIGPKKRGDISIKCLTKIYNNFFITKYEDTISFQPILANMFYAGPREAVHHALIRQKLGFTHFTVGRDHAGADGVYQYNAATNLVKSLKNKLKIKVFCHNGAGFCELCDDVIISGECDHDLKFLQDISGASFRKHLERKEYFELADKDMQKQIFEDNIEIFEQ